MCRPADSPPFLGCTECQSPTHLGLGDSQENGRKPCGVRSKHVKLKEYGPGPCVQQEGVARGGVGTPRALQAAPSSQSPLISRSHPGGLAPKGPEQASPLPAQPYLLGPTALTPTPTMTIVQFVQRRATCPRPQSGVTPAGTGEARPIPTQMCLDTFSSVPSEWSKTPETRAPHSGSVAFTRIPPHPTLNRHPPEPQDP